MRRILLTGATGDIGQAIAKKFLERNDQVITPTRQEMDLENPSSVDFYLSHFDKKINVFIHCAGFNEPKKIQDIAYDDLLKTVQINAFSFYQIVHSLVNQEKILSGGHIVGISSIYGHISRRGRFSYAASKHALAGMVKTLALELGAVDIKVNAVSPGFVNTKLTRQNNSAAQIQNFSKKIPLGRLATVEDIANVVYFMSSTENTFINGQEIIVDGGYLAGGFEE